jgi:hypothetical protein
MFSNSVNRVRRVDRVAQSLSWREVFQMNWGEMDILHKLVAVLCIGSFGLFVLSYFIKRIKEMWEDLRKK